MLKWCIPDDKFLNELRKYEKRIPRTDYGKNHLKPFFGVLFELDDLIYISQVSHPQKRHEKLKENKDFKKIYKNGKLFCVVNLNFMFPIYKECVKDLKFQKIDEYRTFACEEEKIKYINLLKIEMDLINDRKIDRFALDLYKHFKNYPNSKISKRCFNFSFLENACKEIKENF